MRKKLFESTSLKPDAADAHDVANSDQLLRQEEAAALLNVTPRCLENWRHRGEGPKFVRISGRCIRYMRRNLLEFIEGRVRTSTSDRGTGAA